MPKFKAPFYNNLDLNTTNLKIIITITQKLKYV